MNILEQIHIESFSIFKKCTIITILIIAIFQIDMNINYKKPIMAKQPEFKFDNPQQFISALESCINWLEKDTTKYQNVPREITIAQAVIESDYGRSRFAKQGNNLFGVRTWNLDEPHIKPFNDNTSIFGLKVYKNKCDSVKDYIRILNTGSAFEEFRELRFKMLKTNNINPLLLVEKLNRFATDPDYIKIIKRTIIKLRK